MFKQKQLENEYNFVRIQFDMIIFFEKIQKSNKLTK